MHPEPSSPASRAPRRRHGSIVALGLALLVAPSTGCRTYATKTESYRQNWRAGQVEQAAKAFSDRAENRSQGRDAVIWRLEQGTALRAAGRYQESNRAFEIAEARMSEYEARARVRVATEAMSTVTTPANLPYEGRAYDKIMAATYRALNHLALDQQDQARPALLRAHQYQQDAVAENARRIERAQQEAAQRGHAAAIDNTRQHPQFQQRLDSLYAPSNALQPYAEYVNPFTVWLDGIFFLAQARDLSDLERARVSLQRALAFNPNHPALLADLDACERRLRGEPLPPVTYVILENGQAPVRQQVRIDIPIVFANVSYLGTAWPVLQPQSGQLPSLAIDAHSTRHTSVAIASIDRIVARDFEDEKPAIVTRTLVSTLAKGTAAFVANQAASQQDEGLGALVRLATLAYQASVNIADTRTWTTLPKEFQIARFPTPPDRRLDLVSAGHPPARVHLEQGHVNVVYVRSVSSMAPLRISQLRLK